MAIKESGEMYLEAIYVLSKKIDGLHAIDVGEYLGFSKPSVSRALSILKDKNLITVDKESHIFLTEEGGALAEKIFSRHVLIKDCLIRLGVSEQTAEDDACKIEHVLSDETYLAIKSLLENHK
ncbi:MAG: metal-dependent transcriptional regulator [Clostridia bacterium]|nr:metal-dependent transcriptional regulator [Clostridia bacterium]